MANGVDIPDARVAKVRRLRTPGAAAREAGSLLTDFARRRTCSHPLLACACRFPQVSRRGRLRRAAAAKAAAKDACNVPEGGG